VLGYIFAGIALGSIYAIAASGLVVTYVASGVLNFAFGSMAFFLARFYYYLNTQHGWGQLAGRDRLGRARGSGPSAPCSTCCSSGTCGWRHR